MLGRPAHRALSALIGLTVVLAACGGDDPTGSNPNDIVGTWNATSFVAGGVDGVALGMTVTFVFTSNTYAFTITNDQLGLCDPDTDCTDGGTYVATATTVTLDPGTLDEVTLNYTISGSEMVVTGSIDGTLISVTFQRAP